MYAPKSHSKTAKQIIRLCLACLLLAATALTAAACKAAGENVNSETDMIQYLTKTWGQKEYTICDTADNGVYKAVAFTYDDGKLGHIFLSRNPEERWVQYNVFQSALQQDKDSRKPGGIVWQSLTLERELLLLLVSDGTARTVIVYKDDEEIERFHLYKGKNAAYILSVDGVLDEEDDGSFSGSFSFRFMDEKGKEIKLR